MFCNTGVGEDGDENQKPTQILANVVNWLGLTSLWFLTD